MIIKIVDNAYQIIYIVVKIVIIKDENFFNFNHINIEIIT